MTVLVFGKTGQIAKELATLEDTVCLGREIVDLTDPDACAQAILRHRPRAVINAAAYTAVDRAETEEDTALAINALAPAAMARACADAGIPFVHISTDYVFAGTGNAPWQPHAPTAPQNAYGRTKLKGEDAVRASGSVFVILRTSWVVSAHGANFVKTMLRLGAERDTLTVVSDQIGGPTPARDIAAACHKIATDLIATPEKSGVYHFSGAPDCSWANFAREIFDAADMTCTVTDTASQDYPTPAARPENSRLDCDTLVRTFGIARPQWRAGLDDILTDLRCFE